MRKTTLILLILTLAFASMAFKCEKGPSYDGGLDSNVRARSPKGVDVRAGRSISQEQLNAVDAGLDKVFAIAEAPPNNYTGFLKHPNYHVWLVPRDARCQNPGFTEVIISAPWPDGYDNDPNGWDKDPRPGKVLLCVAGFMTRVGVSDYSVGDPGMGVVDDVGMLPTVVRFEAEHNILAEIDWPRFEATQFHYGPNGGHPILGDGPPSSSLMAAEAGPAGLGFEVKGISFAAPVDIKLDSKFAVRKGEKVNVLIVK